MFWNPNKEEDKTKLNVKRHEQHCAPTEYKILSKEIQRELETAFFNYFKLFYLDVDMDYYQMSDFYTSSQAKSPESQKITVCTSNDQEKQALEKDKNCLNNDLLVQIELQKKEC